MTTLDIPSLIRETDNLVDEFWGGIGMWSYGNKTCLLGVMGKALYGRHWIPEYRAFDPAIGTNDPQATAFAEAVAEHLPADYKPDFAQHAYQYVYSYNDDHLQSTDDVHKFLRGILNAE